MTRHRWVKLRLHHYICRVCGAGKVNAEIRRNVWQTTFHLPDGTSVVTSRTPACELGSKTEVYLAKYAAIIAEALKPL